MKIRLTPLNIISAASLTLSVYAIIDFYFIIHPARQQEWGILSAGFYILLAIITFISDLIFRRFLSDIKRIWIIELLFIIFVAILIILFKQI